MQAAEVAFNLFDIFTLWGAPAILQTDNGKEFATFKRFKVLPFTDEELDNIIKELFDLWPQCACVRGRPRHSHSNGGVERLNQSIERGISVWMADTVGRCKLTLG